MATMTPLRKLPENAKFQQGDVFVIFGELFGRGYANGLVNEAKKAGMKIIGITVGRRRENNELTPLTNEELDTAEKNLGGEIINIPLEAGFDFDSAPGKPSPAEMLKNIKPDQWEGAKLDWDLVEEAKQIGIQRFRSDLKRVVAQIEEKIPEGKNVFFAHTMAGGIPRAKILMVIANRVFKGKGNRFLESEKYWKSDIGRLCAENFLAVTAHTFEYLVEETKGIRDKVEASGGQTRYIAYGYHGTEIILSGKLRWQTYTPYKQGYAKMELEEFAKKVWKEGVKAIVFNCPEIRTNSSDLFAGVELSLFPLIKAIQLESGNGIGDEIYNTCAKKLKVPEEFETILSKIVAYHNDPLIQRFHDFDQWPMESTIQLIEKMTDLSKWVIDAHQERKDLITDYLSQIVVDTTGASIFNFAWNPGEPVVWLGHDIIAKQLLDSKKA